MSNQKIRVLGSIDLSSVALAPTSASPLYLRASVGQILLGRSGLGPRGFRLASGRSGSSALPGFACVLAERPGTARLPPRFGEERKLRAPGLSMRACGAAWDREASASHSGRSGSSALPGFPCVLAERPGTARLPPPPRFGAEQKLRAPRLSMRACGSAWDREASASLRGERKLRAPGLGVTPPRS